MPSGRSSQIKNSGKNAQQHYASTSIYKETTSIRKHLLGVFIPKINIFCEKKKCHAMRGNYQNLLPHIQNQ